MFSGRSKLTRVACDCLSTSNRENGDPFGIKISPPTDRKCLDSNLIADSLNEDHGPRRLDLPQGKGGCLYRCIGSMHVASESFSGEFGSLFTIHGATFRRGIYS